MHATLAKVPEKSAASVKSKDFTLGIGLREIVTRFACMHSVLLCNLTAAAQPDGKSEPFRSAS